MGRPCYPRMPDGYVGVSDLSRAIGVSRPRIYTMRKEGMFDGATKTLENGQVVYDSERAQALYKQHINHSKKHQRSTKNMQEYLDSVSIPEPVVKPPVEKPIEKPERTSASMTMTEARALKEQYLAKIKQIEFEEKVGKLLLEEDVKNAAFEMYRKTRDTLINIVDRISAQLAAEMNEADVRRILEGEIRMALAHIRGNFDA